MADSGATIREDDEVRSGGFAVLELDLPNPPPEFKFTLRFPEYDAYLGEDGEKEIKPHKFVAPLIGVRQRKALYSLGPNICFFINDFEIVEISSSGAGLDTGELDWPKLRMGDWRPGKPVQTREQAILAGARSPATGDKPKKRKAGFFGGLLGGAAAELPEAASAASKPRDGEGDDGGANDKAARDKPGSDGTTSGPDGKTVAGGGRVPPLAWGGATLLLMALGSGILWWLTGPDEAEQFAAAKACYDKAELCDQRACFKDWTFEGDALTAEVTKLRDGAAHDCDARRAAEEKAEQEKAAFASAKTCYNGAELCKKAACFDTLTVSPGELADKAKGLKEKAKADCDDATAKAAFASAKTCYNGAELCKKAACFDTLTVSPGELADKAKGLKEKAKADCDDATAKAAFATTEACYNLAEVCKKAACFDNMSVPPGELADKANGLKEKAKTDCDDATAKAAFATAEACYNSAEVCKKAACFDNMSVPPGELADKANGLKEKAKTDCDDATAKAAFATAEACYNSAEVCKKAACFDNLYSPLPALSARARDLQASAEESCGKTRRRAEAERAFDVGQACYQAKDACQRSTCFDDWKFADDEWTPRVRALQEIARRDCGAVAVQTAEHCVTELTAPCEVVRCTRPLRSSDPSDPARFDTKAEEIVTRQSTTCNLPLLKGPQLADGDYTIDRGWYSPDPPKCPEVYAPVTAHVAGGRIAPGATGGWQGTVEANGILDLTSPGNASAKGHYSRASMTSPECGLGWFSLRAGASSGDSGSAPAPVVPAAAKAPDPAQADRDFQAAKDCIARNPCLSASEHCITQFRKDQPRDGREGVLRSDAHEYELLACPLDQR